MDDTRLRNLDRVKRREGTEAESGATPLYSGQRVVRVTIRDLSDASNKANLQMM